MPGSMAKVLTQPRVPRRRSSLATFPGTPVMVDASPSNLHLWQAPLWIYFTAPAPESVKFVVNLSDPVECLYSHWASAQHVACPDEN